MVEGFPFLFFGGTQPHGHLWLENFGPYKWFTVPLIGKLLSERGVPRSLVVKEKNNIPYLIDPELREVLPWGAWDNISATQIRDALSGKLVRLDKAIQVLLIIHSIIALEDTNLPAYMSEVSDDLDIEASILPACYVFDDKQLFDNSDLKEALNRQRLFLSEQDTNNALRELQLGFGVTEFLAHRIALVATEVVGKTIEARVLEDRTDTINSFMTKPILQPNGGLNQISNLALFLRDNFSY